MHLVKNDGFVFLCLLIQDFSSFPFLRTFTDSPLSKKKKNVWPPSACVCVCEMHTVTADCKNTLPTKKNRPHFPITYADYYPMATSNWLRFFAVLDVFSCFVSC